LIDCNFQLSPILGIQNPGGIPSISQGRPPLSSISAPGQIILAFGSPKPQVRPSLSASFPWVSAPPPPGSGWRHPVSSRLATEAMRRSTTWCRRPFHHAASPTKRQRSTTVHAVPSQGVVAAALGQGAAAASVPGASSTSSAI
jgi:hypothetical protein